MKGFLTLLAVTWGCVAWGQDAVQTLVGLPEYGVELTGTVQNPTIVNNSGKTIIGHVLCLEYAALGGCQYRRNLKTRELRLNMKNLSAGIPPSGLDSPLSPPSSSGREFPSPPRVMTQGVILDERTLVRVVLDGVVFADGHFVGPDQGHNFDDIANQIVAEQELAGLVSAARNDPTQREAAWVEVNRIFQNRQTPAYSRTDRLKLVLAADLLNTQKHDGEAAAYDVADREMAIPKLWRAQQ
jgi:hypothetical protein